MTDAPQPWDRQPGETNLWYTRFHDYMMAGRERTLLGTYNAWRTSEERGDKRKPPAPAPCGAWTRAAKKWRWKERAEAWDASQIKAEREAAEEGRKEAARKLGNAAPKAADTLIGVLGVNEIGQKRLAADSILNRAEETAAKQVQGLSDEVRALLRHMGALALRYIPPEQRDAFEKELSQLMKKGD